MCDARHDRAGRKEGTDEKTETNDHLAQEKNGWSMDLLRQSEQAFIQIDVAPLITGITDCLHIFYPQLQRSFTVSMDHLTEMDTERLEGKRHIYPITIEAETILSDGDTHCYLIREEPIGASYTGIMRYVVREAHKHQASQSQHLIIHASVDALFEKESNIETVGVSYPELGVEFTVMLTDSEGTDTPVIMDELMNVMLVGGWNDGEGDVHAPYGYQLIDTEEEE